MVELSLTFLNLFVGGFFLYSAYYFNFVVGKPKVHCSDHNRSFLRKHVPILFQRFWPTFYFCEPRLQTIFRDSFVAKKDVKYIREILTLPDEEEVALDWSQKFYVRSEKSGVEDDDVVIRDEDKKRPIVIILLGLVGSSRDCYAKRLVDQCDLRGFRAVVLNWRGSAGVKLKGTKPYCAVELGDLDHAVWWINNHHPSTPIMLVGFSLGGVLLTNYLASHTSNNLKHITCAMAISITWDLISTMKSLELPINHQVLNKHLLKQMIRLLMKNRENFSKVVDVDLISQSKSTREFDDKFTSKIFGFKDAMDYYRAASLNYKVHDIKVPYLNLNSADDPFSPIESVPTAEASKSSHVVIATTSRGGHIGFLDALWRGQKEGYYERVFGEYASAAFEWGGELKQV